MTVNNAAVFGGGVRSVRRISQVRRNKLLQIGLDIGVEILVSDFIRDIGLK